MWPATLAGALALAACGSPTALDSEAAEPWPPLPADAVSVKTDVLDDLHTSYSGIVDRRRLVIKNDAKWRVFWEQVQEFRRPKRDPPSVDFSSEMIIVAAMGMRTTGGYAIVIDGVFQHSEGILVRVVETSPGPGCGVTMAVTHPITAVVVPRSDVNVRFLERRIETDCE